MLTADFRLATIDDIAVLLELVQEFHTDERLPFEATIDRDVLSQLLINPSLGQLWLISQSNEVVGYLVLTLGYSLESRGRDAFIDELYICPSHHRQGIGTQTLALAETVCRNSGVHTLEVDFANADAQKLYRRIGYQRHDRFLMTKSLPVSTPSSQSEIRS
jgi:ribosomal protein S18 acetylase RimI-like enzyme